MIPSLAELIRVQPGAPENCSANSVTNLGGSGFFFGIAYGLVGLLGQRAFSPATPSQAHRFLAVLPIALAYAPIRFWIWPRAKRVADFERALPVPASRWFQAELAGALVLAAYVFVGALAGWALGALIGGFRTDALLYLVSGFGTAVTALGLAFVLLGSERRPSLQRSVCAMLPFVLALLLFLADFGWINVAVAPWVVWFAWSTVPERFLDGLAMRRAQPPVLSAGLAGALGEARRRAWGRPDLWFEHLGFLIVPWYLLTGEVWWLSGVWGISLLAWIPTARLREHQALRPFVSLPLPSRRALFVLSGIPLVIAPALGLGLGLYQAASASSWWRSGSGAHLGGAERLAQAAALFLILYGVWALFVIRAHRPRQHPIVRSSVSMMLAVIAALASVPVLSGIGKTNLQAAVQQTLLTLGTWMPLPAPVLVLACLGLVWLTWHTCSQRFDRMDAPPSV